MLFIKCYETNLLIFSIEMIFREFYKVNDKGKLHIDTKCQTLSKSRNFIAVSYEEAKKSGNEICSFCKARFENIDKIKNRPIVNNNLNNERYIQKENDARRFVQENQSKQNNDTIFRPNPINLTEIKENKENNIIQNIDSVSFVNRTNAERASTNKIIQDGYLPNEKLLNNSNFSTFGASKDNSKSYSMEDSSSFSQELFEVKKSPGLQTIFETKEELKSSISEMHYLEVIKDFTQIQLDKNRIVFDDDSNYNNDFNCSNLIEVFNEKGFYYCLQIIPIKKVKIVLGFNFFYGENTLINDEEYELDKFANCFSFDKKTGNIYVILDLDKSVFLIKGNKALTLSPEINIIKNFNKENYISKKLKIRPYINVEKDKSCCIEVNPEKGN